MNKLYEFIIFGNLVGGIKETDCRQYPPFGLVRSRTMFNEKGQRLVPKIAGTSTSRARGGFEYWYKEPRANITGTDRKSTRLNSSHVKRSRMPSSA